MASMCEWPHFDLTHNIAFGLEKLWRPPAVNGVFDLFYFVWPTMDCFIKSSIEIE